MQTGLEQQTLLLVNPVGSVVGSADGTPRFSTWIIIIAYFLQYFFNIDVGIIFRLSFKFSAML